VGTGALIGRVGNGAPFPIGRGTQPITMPANGPLMLGINDDVVQDNSGSFSVNISREGDTTNTNQRDAPINRARPPRR
jgi:hypothetical protein